jgi:hypothetical protein
MSHVEEAGWTPRIADIKGGAAYLSMLCGALDTHGLDT